MISVIVPVYNVEKYLERCIKSIVQQTYRNLEIILVNDGSTDSSGTICEEWAIKDKRVRIINQSNSGSSSARNSGIAASRGEYVSFVDADDYLSDKALEAMRNCILITNSDIAVCGCQISSSFGEKITSSDIYSEATIYKGADIISAFIVTLKCSVCNKLFKKELISDIKFPERTIRGEDLLFLSLLLSHSTSLCSTSEIGYFYNKREDSITTTAFSERAFDEVLSKDAACDILTKKFPKYRNQLLVLSFRGRQNLLRVLFAQKIRKYNHLISDYMRWCNQYYSNVKPFLPRTKRIEYTILRYLTPFYGIFAKILTKFRP